MINKTVVLGLAACATALSVMGAVGCGGREWPPTYKTTGIVTLDGAPVERASITFYPKEGQQPANATTDASGRYQLTSFNADDGATVGPFDVAILKFPAIEIDAVPGGVPFDESNNTDAGPSPESLEDPENELPEKYSNHEKSGLSATVTADGENVFNFELTSK
ncbi:MAG: carboxypeptidase regulatory-like domain-containing protein [Planctomycetaceae bacterium]|jgi:hypothetical protein|nr:carboxypeptidase regulatory-like domain-containing protein [Planctomycetaceae bacterium]MBT6642652.1 carboxypeptidase regulatory-like domain-containing protein [Planctomycetaceae bacterium]MBT6920301.1 carboxypeptidase regulatory-like domain-containing protein [Planctomycetaceae bacterium]MBT7728651.1 carboxypeptidase regulatory-like domain-containing protein [Planctomycetaceae bacterium]